MDELSFEQWYALVARELPKLFSATHSGDVTPDTVVGLWCLIEAAPSGVRGAYERVFESDILAAADHYAQPGTTMPVLDRDTNDLEACRILGGILRSAEIQYLGYETGQAVDPADWKVSVHGVRYYLIPASRRTSKANPEPGNDKRPFARRGLANMRVLRCHAGGHDVELLDFREIKSGPDPLAFSGTAFPEVGFHLRDDVTAGHFLVSAVDGPSEEVVRDHLRKAGKSFAHVFPELTIDPAMRVSIADELLVLAGGLEQGPQICVAGTFHDRIDGGYANRGLVYSRTGKKLLDFVKIVAFSDEEKQHEEIISGRTIKVMVTGIGLIAFPICKDLCHSFDTPFKQLDVDFLLTPSCGGEVTIREHQSAAAGIHDRYGCRSFVAQQCYPKRSDEVIGFVLPATGAIRRISVADTFIQQPFSICAVS
jgi:hypothetical protein